VKRLKRLFAVATVMAILFLAVVGLEYATQIDGLGRHALAFFHSW